MISPYQRAEIIRLLRKLELNSVTVTYQHRALGAADHMIDGPVDAWLDGLDSRGGEQLIERLRARL